MPRDGKPLLALTLQHPWPAAICILGKDVENRKWRPGVRLLKGEYFAIHGGKSPTGEDREADLSLLEGMVAHCRPGLDLRDLPTADPFAQGIVAMAVFGGCVTESQSPWVGGPVGWLLENVWPLPEPVPCKGAQGLWEVPPDVRAEIRRQWREAVRAENAHAYGESAAR